MTWPNLGLKRPRILIKYNLWLLLFLGILSSWVRAGLGDVILMNRIGQKGWDVTSKTNVQKMTLPWLALREGSCHVVSCPVERWMWQRTQGDLQPVAHEQPNPANSPVSELGSGSFTGEPSDDGSPGWHLDWALPKNLSHQNWGHTSVLNRYIWE